MSKLGMKLIYVGILLLSGLLSTRAAAQGTYRPPQVYNPEIYNRTRQTMTNRAALRAALERKRRSAAGSGTGGGVAFPTRPAAPKHSPSAGGTTTFRQVAPSIMPRQMALKMGKTPAEQQQLEKLFSELLDIYLRRLKEAGLQPNDVARAASYLVTASYYAANDGRLSLNEAQLGPLRRHMHEAFVEEETFQRMSDRERQELFEECGIVATWIDSSFNIAREDGDTRAMRLWREMGRQTFINILGAPPERVVFTPHGVEYK